MAAPYVLGVLGCPGQQPHQRRKTGKCLLRQILSAAASSRHPCVKVVPQCNASHCVLIAGQDRGNCLRDIWSSCCQLQPRSGGSHPGGLSSVTAQHTSRQCNMCSVLQPAAVPMIMSSARRACFCRSAQDLSENWTRTAAIANALRAAPTVLLPH